MMSAPLALLCETEGDHVYLFVGIRLGPENHAEIHPLQPHVSVEVSPWLPPPIVL